MIILRDVKQINDKINDMLGYVAFGDTDESFINECSDKTRIETISKNVGDLTDKKQL